MTIALLESVRAVRVRLERDILTIDDVKELLAETNTCYKRIKHLEQVINEKQSQAERITPVYSLAPGGGGEGHGHIESDVVKIIMLKESLESELGVYRQLFKRNLDIINMVPNKLQRSVLLEHFVYDNKFVNIADIIGYDERQVYRIYNAGLQWLADNLASCQ